MSEFFPLIKGRALEYDLADGDGRGILITEFGEVTRGSGVWRAKVRQLIQRGDDAPEGFDYVVTKDAGQVVTSAWGLELKLPLRKGQAWRRGPADFVVETLSARKAVPCGDFKGCLELSFLIASGDAGGGRRFYAPGVGLIYASSTDEADPFELSLSRIR